MLNAPAILRQLMDHKVEFVVIGGMAMVSHGSAHVTDDLDVCYSRTERNIAAMVAALSSCHPYLRGVPEGLPFHWDVPTIQAGLNFTLRTDLGPIDFLGEVAGVGNYEQVLAQSEVQNVYDLPVRVLTLEALIAAKRVTGRNKDRAHVLELEELKKMRDAQQGGN